MKTRVVFGAVLVALVAVTAAASVVFLPRRSPVQATGEQDVVDPIARGCALEERILTRIWRGHDPVTSQDVTMIPSEPNFVGTFDLVSHSGPWDYLQEIPLVLYGPGNIAASEDPVTRPSHIVDVYPTIDRLLDVDLPPRDGRPLTEALAASKSSPKLILVVVWDGAGRQSLERWPEAWPTLARLEREGTSYVNATVGSSPSVTSAVHASLGTGAWPRRHGVTGNNLRQGDGALVEAFADGSADALGMSTFADEADRAYGNASNVGLLGWTPWHVGMLGHGRADGGDRDELGLIDYRRGRGIVGNGPDFSTPMYLADRSGIQEEIDRLDRSDGELDRTWMGHDISLGDEATWLTYWNPAWAAFQGDLLQQMIDEGGYGRDDVPDFLFVNFKMTDFAGHRWGLDSEETAAALEAQDTALAEIVRHLDSVVGDYVVVVTADHGHSPNPDTTEAWPIIQTNLIQDLETHLGVPESEQLVEAGAAYGLYLSDEVLADAGATSEDVARFLNGYTIDANWEDDELPEGYEDRGGERVFSAAFAKEQVDEVMHCAFGNATPPKAAHD